MQIKSQNYRSCPAHFAIVYLINDFLKQRLDYHLNNTSMMDIAHKEKFVIKSIGELVQSDLDQYLTSILKQEPYCLLIDKMKYLTEYIDGIIRMWSPSINAALETKISFLQSSYFNTQVA
jgi:hypothetical protein